MSTSSGLLYCQQLIEVLAGALATNLRLLRRVVVEPQQCVGCIYSGYDQMRVLYNPAQHQ